MEVRPQPRQETFLSTPADIAIYGGAAGGGKTWSLLLEPLRHINNKDFGAVIFRRTIPEITNEGALWDEAAKIYPLLDGRSNENDKQYTFPKGARVSFAHMQHAGLLHAIPQSFYVRRSAIHPGKRQPGAGLAGGFP
jgi:hypothetical protein